MFIFLHKMVATKNGMNLKKRKDGRDKGWEGEFVFFEG